MYVKIVLYMLYVILLYIMMQIYVGCILKFLSTCVIRIWLGVLQMKEYAIYSTGKLMIEYIN